MRETRDILQEKAPDKVIVFGGDCSVTGWKFDPKKPCLVR